MAPIWTDATAPLARPAAYQHVVGRGDVEPGVGAGVEPLLRLGRHDRGQPGEITGDKAHGVHRMTVGNGQSVGAEFGVALPGAVRRPGQHTLAHQADMNGHYLADIAGPDQFLHMHNGGIDPRLQADCRHQPVRPGQCRQFHRLRCRPPERPFAIDVLASLQRHLGRRVMRWHAQDDRDRVDLRRGDHPAVVVKGEPSSPSLARRLGAVGSGGADRRQLHLRTRLQRRQVGPGRPGARDAGADQAQPNLVRHLASSLVNPNLRRAILCAVVAAYRERILEFALRHCRPPVPRPPILATTKLTHPITKTPHTSCG